MKNVKANLSNMDKPLLIVTIILFIFGLLNIVNASSQAVVIRYGQGLYSYFNKQLFTLLLGLIAAHIILKIPTRKYYKWMPLLYGGILACLLYLLFFGKSYLGSVNWIDLKVFKFQPSEMAKPVMVMAVALAFEKFCSKLRNKTRYTETDHYKIIGVIIFLAILFPALVFLEKDLGTTIILVTIFAVMFIGSPILKNEKLVTICIALFILLLGAFVMIAKSGSVLSEEQKSRLDFIDPCSNYEEGGYQVCNGFIAINSGGLFGVGIGNSKQVSYLPESHTDSVFSIIAEEYGLIMCTIIFILYLIVLYRIFKIASTVSTLRGKYICLGIGTYIALHIIVNLGGLFGSMPLTGVPLPFLSYGGSYTLALICSLAMVQRIYIEKNTEKIKIR